MAAYFLQKLVTKLTPEMAKEYTAISGDDTPIHLSDASARKAGFSRKVVHGMFTMCIGAKLLSPLLASGLVMQSFSGRFLFPLYVNDQLTTMGVIKHWDDDIVSVEIIAYNQTSKVVMKGEARLIDPKNLHYMKE